MPTLDILRNNSRLTKWAPLALFLLTILFFKGVMSCHLVNLDDPTYVSDSPIHQGLTPFVINWAFTNHFWAGFYIPLTWLSYALDVTVMGNKAEAFHLTNLVLHATNAALVYVLMNRFSADKWRSFFVAALWAVHPLRVTTFPLLLLLMDWWPLRRFRANSYNIRLFLEKIPFLMAAIAIGIVTIIAQQEIGAITSIQAMGMSLRIQTAICGYGQYLLNTVYPIDLAPLIAHPLEWPWSQIFLSASVLLLLTAICVRMWRKNRSCRGPLFGWLWFVITLLPTSGLLQAGTQTYADRFTYFPSIGLMLAIVFAIPSNWQSHLNISRAILALGAAAIIVEGILSANQIPIWNDGGTLWRQTLFVSPDNISARQDYSAYLLAEGKDPQGAIEQCKWITDRYPTENMAWYNWGIALETQGHFTEAIEKYSHSYSLVPSDLLYKRAILRVQAKIRAQEEPIPNF